ncbi:ephrin-B3b [Mobula birostris]|uniref:ephrin-B3b n=1 Tax=Mobula birostris TaxID=1983395 RepID=UPI003B2844F8
MWWPAGVRYGCNLRVLLLLELWLVSAEIMEPIYWNSLNERFRDAQGYVLYPQIGDRMDLICPRSHPPEAHSTPEYEYYRLYLVSREQAESCNTVMSPTILLTCDKPEADTRFTIKFQEFSPNLWGLEFKPQHDYYIITTSDGNVEGLENRNGGACRTRNMKVTLRVGQDPNAPQLPPGTHSQPDMESSSTQPRPDFGTTADKTNSSASLGNSSGNMDLGPGSAAPSHTALIAGSCGASAFLLLLVAGGLALACHRRKRRLHRGQPPDSLRSGLHLGALGTPKRGGGVGGGGNNNGSEPSDIIIPLRSSDSAYCPHYEKVSGDYGHPVYIVQEMPPQSPANIYYKV